MRSPVDDATLGMSALVVQFGGETVDWIIPSILSRVEFRRRLVFDLPMLSLIRSSLALMAALATLSVGSSPSIAATVNLPATLDRSELDAFLEARVKEAKLVGLSVAVVKHGEVVLAKGYGRRSLADARPVEPDTLFAIGSVTKQFTCACILLLAEDGKLKVRDRVAKYYPDLTRAKDITLLDLMNHVSGYPDYYPLDFVDRRMQRAIDPDELLRQYAGGKLDFEPGAQYSYSNTGYILLGRVVEKVSRQPFGEFLAKRILKPLGLKHTVYEPEPNDPRVADGYTTFALSDPEAVAPEARGWIGAAGGIFSTPSDLAQWDLALSAGKVLKRASFELMTRARRLSDGRTSDYGCGLAGRWQGGRRVLTHTGAVSGFNASNAFVPDTRSAVVVMVNLEGGLGELPADLLTLLLKVPAIVPDIAGLPPADAAKAMFAQYQAGRVDRSKLSEECNHFLTGAKLAEASTRLQRFGEPTKVDLLSRRERGGMEVSETRLHFASGALRTLMYRQPDGQVEQFFVNEE